MEITLDVLENFNKENKSKYTLEEWGKSNFTNLKTQKQKINYCLLI